VRVITATALVWCAAMWNAPAHAATTEDQQQNASAKQGVTVTVFPLIVQAPIFGAEINLPSLPGGGGGGTGDESGDVSESTDFSLNSAYEVGIEVVADRWLVEARGLWTKLDANRQSPRINVDTTTYFLIARGGVRFAPGLYATGGVRAVHVKLDALLTLPVVGNDLSGMVTKNFWDPMIGVEARIPLGRAAHVGGVFEGGGFGVGTDVDVSGEFRFDWHVASHFDIRAGYSMLYYKWTVADVSIGSFRRTLVSHQTLHGPIVGFGIPF
jgi:hypothetical protein